MGSAEPLNFEKRVFEPLNFWERINRNSIFLENFQPKDFCLLSASSSKNALLKMDAAFGYGYFV